MSVGRLKKDRVTGSGNTAGRPSNPVIGDTYYNGELEILEIFNGTSFVAVSAPPSVPSITSVTDVGNVAFASGGTFTVAVTAGAGGSTPSQFNATTTAGGFTGFAATSPVSITGLTPNTSFSVVANAQNNFGITVNSAPSAPVLATTLPEAPTISVSPVNTGAGGTVEVAFSAGNNGGKSITNYKFSIDNGSTFTTLSPAQTTSPLTISGLTNDTSITFRLKAVNANGDSLQSNQSASVTPSLTASVQYVIVAGGGGGGGGEGNSAGDGGGGGGAGGLITGTAAFELGTYSIAIGAGGAGGPGSTINSFGNNGTLSRIHQSGTTVGALTVVGGGGGGADNASGQNGGCGGGSSGDGAAGGVGSVGFNGGTAASGRSGGGGGGMGGVGGSQANGGNGGAGVTEAIKSIALCGGGSGAGGSNNITSGTTTSGGGNNATGTANKGGGGGGGRSGNIAGYQGGSGVIILKTTTQATGTTGSPIATTSGAFYIYEFQSNGTITF